MSANKSHEKPPEPLRVGTAEAKLLEEKVWRRCNVQNLHFMGALVGREGSGKSWTALKLAEAVDPTFNAKRVMFEPEAFLERLKKWKANGETKGKAVVADEAGVGLGVRTWYQKDQILFNQVLQVIRDENMAIFFTLPRLNELDSQARGRIHAFIEMTDKRDGEWAEVKWLDWKPARDERNKIYRKTPEIRINGAKRPIKRIRVGPPSAELAEAYEERKNEFQNSLYQEALDEMADDEESDMSVKDIAMEIADGDISSYVARHNQTKQPHIKWELIRVDYGISQTDARTVKSILEQSFTTKELETHA